MEIEVSFVVNLGLVSMTKLFRVRFFGTFKVSAPDGSDVTPKGNKVRGLLALLCEADDMRRGRRWLAATLWSDRSADQANGSLRQALTDVRNALGKNSDVMAADRVDVWLDKERIETDLTDASPFRTEGREFLEGLDIRDEAFNDWLRDARARYAAEGLAEPVRPTGSSRSISIRAALSESGSPAARIAGLVIADEVAQTLENSLSAVRLSGRRRRGAMDSADVEVRCDVAEDGERSVVFLRIESSKDGRILFSGHRSLRGTASEAISAETVTGLVHSASSRLIHSLPRALKLDRPEVAALGYSSLGLSRLSTFTAEGFSDAHDHFEKAFETDRNSVFLAWRAFVRMAQLVEGVSGDRLAWIDEIEEATQKAVRDASGNGLTLALVSLTRIMLEDELEGPAQLAQQAIRMSGNSLFARQTLALAHSATGDVNRAYTLSRACQIADPADELGHLWSLYHALVCIAAGRLDEARLSAARSATLAPSFVAPRRQLVALCAHAGDLGAARSHLRELARLEADFTLDRYLSDDRYPNLTLRKAGLIKPLRDAPLED